MNSVSSKLAMAGFEVAIPPDGQGAQNKTETPFVSASAGATAQTEEALYNDGATPLFLAVEETDWIKAYDEIQRSPSQAGTWIVSTGTVETTFDWSLWRRLPLHEACRRQAPAWLVSHLLSAFPPAASLKTQFGELPIHLAVECGAAPEVVNLLLAWNWRGIAETDQSGRNPFELLNDSELLDQQEYKILYETLQQATHAFEQMQIEQEEVVNEMQVKHAAGLVAVKQQHDDDLALEQEQQEKLLAEVERLKGSVGSLKEQTAERQVVIENFVKKEVKQVKLIESLNKKIVEVTEAKRKENNTVVALEQVIKRKNSEIEELNDNVADLQAALQRLTAWHHGKLNAKLEKTQRNVRKMVESFVSLHDVLSDHGGDLRAMLEMSGIEELPLPSPEKQEEKKDDSDPDVEDEILDDDAMELAALAAAGVLDTD